MSLNKILIPVKNKGDKFNSDELNDIVNKFNLLVDYVSTLTVNSATVPLVIISGQSNAQGLARRSDLYSGALAAITPSVTREFQRVKIWNPTTGTWQNLKVGAAGSAGTGGGNELGQQGSEHPGSYEDGFGAEIGMAQRWEQYNTTDTLYIIKAALGATSIDRWEKSANDLYQSRLAAYVTNGLAALKLLGLSASVKGFYWMQGEADAGSASTYQTRLTIFMNNVKNDFLQSDTIKVIGGLLPGNGYEGVISAQKAYVATEVNTYWNDASGYGHIPNDSVHISAASMLKIGANDIFNKIFNTTGSIDVTGTTVNNSAATGNNTGVTGKPTYNLVMTNDGYNSVGKYGSSLKAGYGKLDSTPIPTNGTFTLEVWVKTGSGELNVAVGQNFCCWIGINSGNAQANYGKSDNEVKLTTNVNIADNGWHHMALTLGAGGGKLWLDGNLVSSSTTTMSNANAYYGNTFEVGTFVGAYVWNGEIDDVAISNVEKYLNTFTPAMVNPAQTSLVCLYKLDGNGNDTANK